MDNMKHVKTIELCEGRWKITLHSGAYIHGNENLAETMIRAGRLFWPQPEMSSVREVLDKELAVA